MNATEPTPLAGAIPPSILKRLEAMGLTTAAELEPQPRQETEDERQERLAARCGVFQARWATQVPPMYSEASWEALDESQRFTWPDDSLNLVLAGKVGTGKTYAAYALGNTFSARGTWVQSITVSDFLVANRPDGDAQVARAARECQVLILDDLSAAKASEFSQEQMTGLLDLRIREGRRTIITTNAPEPDLEAAWGIRFMDRLRYRRTVHVFVGESRRTAAW